MQKKLDSKKIKLVVSDLDGTLLNNNHLVSDYTKSIIKKINLLGIDFIIATGRPLFSSEKYLDSISNKSETITFNGAIVFDKDRKIIYEKPIDESAGKLLVDMAIKSKLYFHTFINDKWNISSEYSEWFKIYKSATDKKDYTVGFKNLENFNFTKVMVIGEYEELKEIEKIIMSEIRDVVCVFSGKNYLEVLNKDVSKGSALEHILNKKNILPEETIAFGDNYNDIEMLKLVNGVAMENGEDEVKLHAKYITTNNDKDGVANFLSELFNI